MCFGSSLVLETLAFSTTFPELQLSSPTNKNCAAILPLATRLATNNRYHKKNRNRDLQHRSLPTRAAFFLTPTDSEVQAETQLEEQN